MRACMWSISRSMSAAWPSRLSSSSCLRPAGGGGRRGRGGGGSLDGGRGHRRLICRWRGVGRCHGSVVGDELVGLRRLGGRAASPEAGSGALVGRRHRHGSPVFLRGGGGG